MLIASSMSISAAGSGTTSMRTIATTPIGTAILPMPFTRPSPGRRTDGRFTPSSSAARDAAIPSAGPHFWAPMRGDRPISPEAGGVREPVPALVVVRPWAGLSMSGGSKPGRWKPPFTPRAPRCMTKASTRATAVNSSAGTSWPSSQDPCRARASGMSWTRGTRASWAISRSLAATSPAPFATTRGAPFSGSYFRATATWVGLTSSTSASATSLIIRFCDIARATPLRCAFMCGSPSACLYSWVISYLLILSCLHHLHAHDHVVGDGDDQAGHRDDAEHQDRPSR